MCFVVLIHIGRVDIPTIMTVKKVNVLKELERNSVHLLHLQL